MNRPRPTKLWKKRFVKIMMIGDSGLGKTTLVRTLLSGKSPTSPVSMISCPPQGSVRGTEAREKGSFLLLIGPEPT